MTIPFPDISPEIFTISAFGTAFSLRWYALAYIVGILIGWRLIVRALRTPRLWPDNSAPMTAQQLEDLMSWIVLGIIAGGRLGYVLFYKSADYLSDPLAILRVWEGGMSFHGGFAGVIVAVWWYSRRHALPVAQVADALAFAAPVGLFLGRIANFINSELWGRPSTLPWAVIFPGERAQDCAGVIGPCARHPSQLYEAGLEGLVLGTLLIVMVWGWGSLKRPGLSTGLFFMGYGMSRFVVEFARQADAQFITPVNPMGYVVHFGQFGLSMGQTLSLPMILIGLAVILWARRRA